MSDWHGNDDNSDARSRSAGHMSMRELRAWAWYTMFPTLYVDEDSDSQDLLWQQVLEQRALRATIWVAAVVVPVLFAVLVVVGVVVLR